MAEPFDDFPDYDEHPTLDEPEDWDRPNGIRLRFDKVRREEYLDLLRNGMGRQMAARQVGMTPRTPQRWRLRHPKFAQREAEAEMEAHEQVEDALFQAASSGNTTAMIFYLTNRAPERWADKRAPQTIRMTGEDGGPIRLDLDIDTMRANALKIVADMRERQARLDAAEPAAIDVQSAEVNPEATP